MSTPNTALLRQTLAHIEANPQSWDQEHYRCGTGMCFAGWAAELDGGRWVTNDPDDPGGEELVPRADDPADDVHRGIINVRDRAKHVLGLDEFEAEDLFHPDNSLWVLRRIVAEYCGDDAERGRS